jgi:phosphomannomutase
VGAHYYDRIDMVLPESQRDATIARVMAARPKQVAGLKVTQIDTLDGFRYILDDGGWMLIRFSGTEPLVRVYTETTDKSRVQAILADGRKLVESGGVE